MAGENSYESAIEKARLGLENLQEQLEKLDEKIIKTSENAQKMLDKFGDKFKSPGDLSKLTSEMDKLVKEQDKLAKKQDEVASKAANTANKKKNLEIQAAKEAAKEVVKQAQQSADKQISEAQRAAQGVTKAQKSTSLGAGINSGSGPKEKIPAFKELQEAIRKARTELRELTASQTASTEEINKAQQAYDGLIAKVKALADAKRARRDDNVRMDVFGDGETDGDEDEVSAYQELQQAVRNARQELRELIASQSASVKEIEKAQQAYEVLVDKMAQANGKDVITKKEREAAISKQLTGQMIESVNAIGKQSDGMKKLNADYKEWEKTAKSAAQVHEKEKTAREASISKEWTGRMRESIDAIGKQTDGIKKLNAWYKELERTSERQAAKEDAALRKSTFAQRDRERAIRQAANADAMQRVNQAALAKNADLHARANSRLVGSFENLIAKRDIARKKLRDLMSAEKQNTAEIRKAQREYDRLSEKINKVNAAATNFGSKTLRGMVGGLRNLAAAFGWAGGVYMFADMTRQGFNLARQLDSLNFAMRTVITDSEELARTQAYLARITEDYGANIVTTTERYNKFLAAAKQSNVSLDDTEKIFGTMTKAAGSLGLKTHELEGVYLALEQMLSKGKVTTEELRRQLGERLPGAFGIMADAIGVTVVELDGMLRKGEILSAEALPKFADAVEKAYGLDQINRVENLNASVERLSNAWVKLVGNITKSEGAVSKALMSMIDGATYLVDSLNFINSSLKDMEELGNQTGRNQMVALLKQDVDELGHSIERAAELRLPSLMKRLEEYNKELGKLQKKERSEWGNNFFMAIHTLGGDTISDFIRGSEIKKVTEMTNKIYGMIEVAREAAGLPPIKLYPNPEDFDPKVVENASTALNFYKEKLAEVDGQLETMKDPATIHALKEERKQITKNIEEWDKYIKTLGRDWTKFTDWEFDTEATNNLADRAFFVDKLADAQRRYNETTGGDDASRKAIQAEIDILKEAIAIWDGNTDAKNKNGDVTKTVIAGSLDALNALKSELEDERDRLATTTEARERYNDQIREVEKSIQKLIHAENSLNSLNALKNKLEEERDQLATTAEKREWYNEQIKQTEAQIWKLVEAMEALREQEKTFGGDFSMEGTAKGVFGDENDINGFQQFLRDKEPDDGINTFQIATDIIGDDSSWMQILNMAEHVADEEIRIEMEKQALMKYIRDKGLGEYSEMSERQLAIAQASMEREAELRKEFNGAARDLLVEGTGALMDGRVEKVDEEIAKNREYYAELLANHQWSEEQRDSIEAERDLKEAQLEKKKRKREKEAFLVKQGMALAEIAIETAKGVATATAMSPATMGASLTWIPLIIATGAAQAALVVAQSIPKFEKGTENAPEGIALVDEKRPEVHTDRKGNIKSFGLGKPNLRYLEKGDKIYKSHDHFFKTINEQQVQQAVWNMNLASTGQELSQSQVDNSLLREMNGMRGDIDRMGKRIEKLASRPVSVNNTVTIDDKRPY